MNLKALFRALCLLSGLCLFFLPRSADAQGGAVAHFLQARRSVGTSLLPSAQMTAAQADPAGFAGRTLEVSAQVGGFVTADSTRTVLLSLGTLALAARMLPGAGESAWMASGQWVRALVRVDSGTGEASSPRLTLLAAAPEADLAAMERGQGRSTVLTSRGALSERGSAYGQHGWEDHGRVPNSSVVAPAELSARARQIYSPYWNAVRNMNPRLASNDVNKITTSILYFSDQNDVDPRLIMAMIICESGFDIHSTSRTGAAGLGQLMPSTARGLGVTDPYDPVQNIAASVRLLRGHLDTYGGAPAHAGVIPLSQIALTMAAYNAGPGAVRRYHGVPPYRETKRYVAKVAALYEKMCGQELKETKRL